MSIGFLWFLDFVTKLILPDFQCSFYFGETKVKNKDAELKKHRKYAQATFKKDQRINIRISSRDLQALKKRALAEGIPYQTLVASVLHKYVDDRLVDREIVGG